jgi:3,4-dihydroxy 2-butanone 4-phosphate synthase/GTP cyclohydrolase II
VTSNGQPTGTSTIPAALQEIADGGMVVVVDDEDRENEGDLIMAAEHAVPADLAFLIRHTSGVVCVAITGARCDALGLPLMVPENTARHRTAFTHTVDLAAGTTTGISAADRSATIRALADGGVDAEAFHRPGHVFPLRAREGGVLSRAGHTEAAVDLARLAGLAPAGVLCEIVNDDGTMARRPELERFAAEHGLPLITIADLIAYRRRVDVLVERTGEARLPTPWGEFRCVSYRSVPDGAEHVAFALGDLAGDPDDVLVRVHSECLTGDVFRSRRCDCGPQLEKAMAQVAAVGRGVVVYLRGHEGRGIGLGPKLRAYELQDGGRDTVDANLDLGEPVDSRTYGAGAQILLDLGVRRVRLLTNNPAKYRGLSGQGLDIVGREPLETVPNPENLGYLRTKKRRLGHLLGALEEVQVPAEGPPPGRYDRARPDLDRADLDRDDLERPGLERPDPPDALAGHGHRLA